MRRVLRQHENEFLYNVKNKEWLFWDEQQGKWTVDEKNRINEIIKNMIVYTRQAASIIHAAQEIPRTKHPTG